jgi:two-component system, cell cycle response regulator
VNEILSFAKTRLLSSIAWSAGTARILIAEDDPVSRRLLEAKLVEWGYEVVVARDGDEAWQALQAENAPQLAILDWMMPRRDGVAVCREVRKHKAEPYTYLILLTAQAQEGDIVTGMDAGADDYIAKPFKSSELKVRLRAGQRIIELQNDLIAAREALRAQATHDPLTGLWNHEEILRILGLELVRAERERQSVGVIMADFDHFKRINDTYGHLAGDAVLRAAAKTMLSLLRPYDAIGRYGGDEFLVVLPGCDSEHATGLAERLLAGIDSHPVDTAEGTIEVSLSLGIGISGKETGTAANAVVRAADRALYRAKEKGRDRVDAAVEGDARQETARK